ncbi:sulfopyruvate decarboxylase TPP-binding subunit [Streptacidiphilus sp. BW17]|uniref:thiamine pyrophosphate-binding protein n=1 Tax=Streptacidiphilus sp. BW17 TaxID=3156274 RepID=UPI003512C86E
MTTLTVAEGLLRAGFDCAVGVPDSHLTALLEQLHRPSLPVYCPPREDCAVAVAVGLTLAGARPLVFMKNAGLFTTGDALTSLARDAAVPLALLVGWAGTGSDRLPHHVVTGERTTALLDGLAISWTTPADTADLAGWFAGHRAAGHHSALLIEPQEAHR